MKTFFLKISSPEGDLFSGEAVKLVVRGVEGELAVLAGHIHMNYEEKITEKLMQYTASSGLIGAGREIIIK